MEGRHQRDGDRGDDGDGRSRYGEEKDYDRNIEQEGRGAMRWTNDRAHGMPTGPKHFRWPDEDDVTARRQHMENARKFSDDENPLAGYQGINGDALNPQIQD